MEAVNVAQTDDSWVVFPYSVLCGYCREDLVGTPVDEMADHKVYKLGELNYIELAHLDCVRSMTSPGKLLWGWESDILPQEGPRFPSQPY